MGLQQPQSWSISFHSAIRQFLYLFIERRFQYTLQNGALQNTRLYQWDSAAVSETHLFSIEGCRKNIPASRTLFWNVGCISNSTEQLEISHTLVREQSILYIFNQNFRISDLSIDSRCTSLTPRCVRQTLFLLILEIIEAKEHDSVRADSI